MAKKNVVNATSDAYDMMQPRWCLIDALFGGTEALRAAGVEYLPQHEQESNDQYQIRLETTVLENFFELTHQQLVGRVFDDPPSLNDEVPDAIEEISEDIDGQGTALPVFCKDWFGEAFGKGFAHVLIDFPAAPVDEAGNAIPQTAADTIGRRPFWKLLPPENVIFLREAVIDGITETVHVRILEERVVIDGWLDKCIPQVRVLDKNADTGEISYELYEQEPKTKKFLLVESGPITGVSRLPFVTFYAGRKDFAGCAKPPLLDLGYLNIRHWQSTSDQNNVLTVARFPMLAGSGVDTGAGQADGAPGVDIVVGPKQYLSTTNAQGKFYYVEHTGAAINAGREDLKSLQEAMSNYGAEFLKRKPGTQTATERALDSSESVSDLETISRVFADCVAEALQFTAEWMGLPEGGGVVLHTDFEQSPDGNAPALDTLNKARAARDISRETYLAELQRRNILAETVDIDDEADKIANETDLGGGGLDDGTPDPNDNNGKPNTPPQTEE